MQGKVSKLINLRFAESTDPIASEALAKLQIEGTSFNEVWEARTKLVGMWYRCWLESQQYEDVSLAEYQDPKTHIESLAKESYELKGLIRRVINVGNELFSDPELSPNWHWKDYLMDLDKLVVDCREALK